jgi:undecaprenyl-diphosphatase
MPSRRIQRFIAWEHALVRHAQGIRLPRRAARLLVVFVRVGDGWGWALVAAGLFLFLPWLRFKIVAFQALLAVAISLPLYWGLKLFFRRQRPFAALPGISARVPPLDRYSFPSGHTMNNLAVALTLALNFPRLWPLAVSVPLLLGLLRIFFGVHFLTDIGGGILLGVMSSLSAHWLFLRLFS